MLKSPSFPSIIPVVMALLLTSHDAGAQPVQLPGSSPLQTHAIPHVMKAAEVAAAFAQIEDSWDVYVKTNHAVTFRVSTKPSGWTDHPDADEFWFVYGGSARLSLGSEDESYNVSSGDLVAVPRELRYQIEPTTDRFEYVAVRIFVPLQRRPPPEGSPASQGPLSHVVTKEMIDETFATEPRSLRRYFASGISVNQIIYNGAIGPYESHEVLDQIYFVRHGTARGYYDGRILGAKVTAPGQIRGTGVTGAVEYTIAPGDIVWVPRNELHFVDPGMNKIGYFIIDVPGFR